jgi:hypothetical protein
MDHIQENNSEGCQWCSAEAIKDVEPIVSRSIGNLFGNEIKLEAYVFGNLMTFEFSAGEQGTDERVRIDFCPFCGRKL